MSIVLVLLGCAPFLDGDEDREDGEEGSIAGPPELWVLVHPTDAPPTGTGVFRVDLASGDFEGPIELPAQLVSPHALTDTGQGLLVGGYVDDDTTPVGGDERSVLRVDYDGAEIESHVTGMCEGLAFDGTNVFVASDSRSVERVTRDWESVAQYEVRSVIQDVAVGDRLYVLSNDSGDTIRAYDLANPGGAPTVVTHRATSSNEGYAMTWWPDGGVLLVADHDDDGNFVRQLDPRNGDWVGMTRIGLRGWITAIAIPTADAGGIR